MKCPACGAAVLGVGESARTSELMLQFNKQVNAAIVDPNFIAGVRKKLHLDQREAAEIFGGGVMLSHAMRMERPSLLWP